MRKISGASPARGAMVLACAAGCLAALVLTGCASARPPKATATAAAGQPRGKPVPASALPRLRAIAELFVRGDGETAARWASVVSTSSDKALAAASPWEEATVGRGDTAVYLITIKGRFLPLPVPSPVPPGGWGPLTGSYLSLVIDASTFQVLDVGLRARPPRVAAARLGPVTCLTPLARPAPVRAGMSLRGPEASPG